MPRQARHFSKTGYLHVVMRGIGKQVLFEDGSDYRFFLSHLATYSFETGVVVCAYCLMENHVHLLLLNRDGNISKLMKKLGVSYAGYYNYKYDRVGHLFQDRYLSKPIDNAALLVKVFRYILMNPEKAGICAASEYEWSSFYAYKEEDSFVDTSSIAFLIGSWEDYLQFMNSGDDGNEKDDGGDECENDAFLEHFSARSKRNDEWAMEIIRDYLRTNSGTALQNMPRCERNKALRVLNNKGLSIRQIERLTGISRGTVRRAIRV